MKASDYELLEFENGSPFSTRDRDNDKNGGRHCAEYYQGGWWFKTHFRLCVNCKKYINGHDGNFRYYETYMAVRKIN